jgi:photosystem II stability/assembly factor-like uncharacterized protein
MRPFQTAFRAALAVLFLLVGGVPTVGTTSAAAPTIAGRGDLLAFQLVAPGSGWALMGQQLFWTNDGGPTWRDITPPALGGAEIRAASFADTQHGWVVATAPAANGGLSYTLARTADGGQTWQTAPLALFAAGDVARVAGAVFLQFIDTNTGWLIVKQATSMAFDLGTLFRTDDGGGHWARLSLPEGEPVHFTNAQDGVLGSSASLQYATHDGGQTWLELPTVPSAANGHRAPSMATSQDGWAKSTVGECASGQCRLTTQLESTRDGGQTWTAVKLPGGPMALTQSFSAPKTPDAPTAPTAGGLWSNDFSGTDNQQGFDFCDPAGGLPTSADMETWYLNSPYKVWGLYLGGSSNPTRCHALTKDYVLQLAQEGWRFIPTWVGPQAPCTDYKYQMDPDPNVARGQGVAEADLALAAANNVGLTLADQSGTIINYDVEYFNQYPDTTCQAAVDAFISGWSGELRAHNNLAGVYGAPCGQRLANYAGIPNVPDIVWAAWWVSSQYDSEATVLSSSNFAPCGYDNSLWTNHQRMKQYAGGHDETWGGVTFNIDSDVIDSQVAQVPVNCIPNWGQVSFFVDWYFGGQCVVKSLGLYPTAAALTLPGNSISSFRVGPHATVTVCRGEFYSSPCQTFSNDAADLTSQPIGNDVIHSAQITTSLILSDHIYFPTALTP